MKINFRDFFELVVKENGGDFYSAIREQSKVFKTRKDLITTLYKEYDELGKKEWAEYLLKFYSSKDAFLVNEEAHIYFELKDQWSKKEQFAILKRYLKINNTYSKELINEYKNLVVNDTIAELSNETSTYYNNLCANETDNIYQKIYTDNEILNTKEFLNLLNKNNINSKDENTREWKRKITKSFFNQPKDDEKFVCDYSKIINEQTSDLIQNLLVSEKRECLQKSSAEFCKFVLKEIENKNIDRTDTYKENFLLELCDIKRNKKGINSAIIGFLKATHKQDIEKLKVVCEFFEKPIRLFCKYTTKKEIPIMKYLQKYLKQNMDKKKAMKSTDLSFNELIVFIDKELLESSIAKTQVATKRFKL